MTTEGRSLSLFKPKNPCYACGNNAWWWRPTSYYGGLGEWTCGICHPRPPLEAHTIQLELIHSIPKTDGVAVIRQGSL